MTKFSNRADMVMDTNILINLAGLNARNEGVIKSLKKQQIYSSLQFVLHKIKNDEIRAIIVPTVYSEIMQGVNRFGFGTLNFIRRNNFYVVEIPPKKANMFFGKAKQMATIYSQELTERQIKNIKNFDRDSRVWYPDRVFDLTINKRTQEIIPINDAFVMAETSVLGVPILSNDPKHFYVDGRPQIISYLNSSNNLRSGARPYNCFDVVGFLKNRDSFLTVDNNWESSIKNTSMER